MVAQPQPEQAILTETSIMRVSENIAGKLKERLPNIKINLVDSRLKVTPTHKITNFYLGAEKQNETGQSIREDEISVGRENVAKTAKLFEQELQSTDEILPLTDSVRDIFYSDLTSSVLRVTARNNRAQHILAKSNDYVQSGLESIPRLSEKGIPEPIGQAIVWATARATASTIEGEATKEVKQIDDEYIRSAQTRLTEQIAEVESLLVESRASLQSAESNQAALNARALETNALFNGLNGKVGQLQRFPTQIGEKVTQDALDKVIKDLKFEPFRVEKQGMVFKKEVVTELQTGVFDNSMAELVDVYSLGNAEMKSALEAFGFYGDSKGMINLLNETAETVAQTQVGKRFTDPAEQARQLFYEAKNILQVFPSAELVNNLNAQENAFYELVKKNPQQAVVFASQLFARSFNLNLLTASIRKYRFPENQAWPITSHLLRNYQHEIGTQLENKANFQTAKSNENQAQVAKTDGDKALMEKRRTVYMQERNLSDSKMEQDNLTIQRKQRLDALKAEIFAKLLFDQYGKPVDVETLAANPWRLTEFVINSQLFSDITTAVSFGMPRIMAGYPGGNVRRGILNNMVHNGVIQETNDSLMQSEDMLKTLIEPLVPKEHPTRELALKLTGELLRRYTSDKRVLMMGGFNITKEISQENIAFRWNKLKSFFTAILKGGRVVDIVGQIPPLKLSEVDLSEGSQETYNSIKKRFDDNGQTNAAFQALETVLRQVDPNGNGFVISENSLLHFDQPEFDRDELLTTRNLMDQGQGVDKYNIVAGQLQLFDNAPYNRPIYLVENKS